MLMQFATFGDLAVGSNRAKSLTHEENRKQPRRSADCMRFMKPFVLALLSASIAATPAMSAQRKTLFDHLFPKAYEKRQKRLQTQRQKPKPVEAPKVARTRYYTYKTTAVSALKIKPVSAVVAQNEVRDAPDYVITGGISGQGVTTGIAVPQISQMTSDLQLISLPLIKAEKFVSKAVSDYYDEDQTYHWIDENGDWNVRARAAIKLFEAAEEYGLRKSDYTLNIPEPIEFADETLANYRLQRELLFSVVALRYAMDASFGTINANRLSGYHDLPVRSSRAGELLEQIMGGGLVANTLRSFHPTSDKFLALKTELAELKHQAEDVIDLPEKILIKPGRKHDDLPKFVAAIKKRGSEHLVEEFSEVFDKVEKPSAPELVETDEGQFSSETPAGVDDMQTRATLYDDEIVALVKAYQKEAGLGPDGVIGPATSRNLKGVDKQSKVRRVVLAMERLRWLPHELGSRHVFINQPEFRARYVRGGKEHLSMKIVVGKKSNQTNFFYDEIEKVVYNPYWGMPKSILVNEYLPKLRANPAYFDQIGYEVATSRGKVSSTSVDWFSVGARPSVSVRQPPGPKNALGEVKILFPNKHAIYMHDTPSKHLFKKDYRAYSHGCIRLHDPKAMAAAVLGKNKQQISASISTGKNQTELLKQKIPVYVSYFTAWPQKNGEVRYFGDMYGRDAHLWKAMEATKAARASLTLL